MNSRPEPRSPWLLFVALVTLALAHCDRRERREEVQPRARRERRADAPRRHPVAPSNTPAPAPNASPVASAAGSSTGGRRPNILVVMADDQRADTVACMPRMRALLAARGTTFTHHFASTPLCCPARSTFLTGLYPRHHGVLSNGDVEDEGDEDQSDGLVGAMLFQSRGNEERTVAVALRASGYRTGFFGKYLNAYDRLIAAQGPHVPPGWDEWRAFAHAEYFNFTLVERGLGETSPTVRFYPTNIPSRARAAAVGCRRAERQGQTCAQSPGENYSTDLLATQVRAFVRRAATDRVPFFAVMAVKAPHGPFESPARYQPDPDVVAFTRAAESELAACPYFAPGWTNPAIHEADIADKPEWIQRQGDGRLAARLERIRRQQLVSVLAVEDALASIDQELGAAGVRDDTVVIYLGDNGYAWGEHRYVAKNCAYEPCIRVPLVVRDPRHPTQGRSLDTLTVDVDIAPTLLELAGATLPTARDGQSLAPIITGQTEDSGRTEVFLACWGRGPNPRGSPGTVAAVRTARWKFIEHFTDQRADTIREYELYDLARDPLELDNLVRPRVAALDLQALSADARQSVQALRQSLDAWRTDAARPSPAPPAAPATGTPAVRAVTVLGEATRVEQLIGDADVERLPNGAERPTATQTRSRFGVFGADLGYSFEHAGRLWFLFGDSRIDGLDRGAPDPVAFTTATRPPLGRALEFLTRAEGAREPFVYEARGVPAGGSEVPASGVSVNGVAYVLFKTDHHDDEATGRSVLTRFDPATRTVSVVREFSNVQTGGHFLKAAFRVMPANTPGMPTSEPVVLAWGTGRYRQSAVYLQCLRVSTFGNAQGAEAWFYVGLGTDGVPRWSRNEAEARPVMDYDRAGDVSVTRCEPAGLWLALYDRRESLGVALARSTSPWGPFTEAGTLFTPSQWRGRILWDPERADAGLRPGPLMNRQDEARGEALTKRGGAYAPYVIERFTRVEGGSPDTIVLDWLLSTWNPYVVHLMESRVRWTTR